MRNHFALHSVEKQASFLLPCTWTCICTCILFFQLVCKGILKFCLRGLLGDAQRKTLFYFFDCLTLVCAEYHDSRSISNLQVKMNTAIALLERDFPRTIQVDIHVHVHIASMY